jgi:predicted NBD/HSP70 family sugar kinase
MAGSRAIADAVGDSLGPVTIKDIIGLAQQGDLVCSRAIADVARHIAKALAALYNLLNPELTIVGGELAAAGQLLLAPLQVALEHDSLHNPLHPPKVELSSLGDDAAALGAVTLALDAVPFPTTQREVSA